MTAPEELLQKFERGLSREIPRALTGEIEGIHQLRVIGRRLRVALLVLPQKPDGKRVRRTRRELRNITRAAGTSRDLDVSVEIFSAHLQELDGQSPEAITLLRRMKAARHRSRVRTTEALLDTEIARMRRDLRRLRAEGVIELEPVGDRIRQLATSAANVLFSGLAELGDRYDADALHALRRRIRGLRYLSDMSESLYSQGGRAAKRFKRMQDELGTLHDSHVLSVWMRNRASIAQRRGNLVLVDEANSQAEWAEAAAIESHRAWLLSQPVDRVGDALAALLEALPASLPANDDEHVPMSSVGSAKVSGEEK